MPCASVVFPAPSGPLSTHEIARPQLRRDPLAELPHRLRRSATVTSAWQRLRDDSQVRRERQPRRAARAEPHRRGRVVGHHQPAAAPLVHPTARRLERRPSRRAPRSARCGRGSAPAAGRAASTCRSSQPVHRSASARRRRPVGRRPALQHVEHRGLGRAQPGLGHQLVEQLPALADERPADQVLVSRRAPRRRSAAAVAAAVSPTTTVRPGCGELRTGHAGPYDGRERRRDRRGRQRRCAIGAIVGVGDARAHPATADVEPRAARANSRRSAPLTIGVPIDHRHVAGARDAPAAPPSGSALRHQLAVRQRREHVAVAARDQHRHVAQHVERLELVVRQEGVEELRHHLDRGAEQHLLHEVDQRRRHVRVRSDR